MDNHILITGGTGYLGSLIAEELLKKGYNVSVLVRATSSLSRLESLRQKLNIVNVDDVNVFFENEKVDGIIHVATNYGRKGEKRSEILRSNLFFPMQLLELAIEHNVKFFINTDTSLPRELNVYSLSKAQFRDWLKREETQLKIINIIPEYFYGPNDDDSKFVSGIIRKLFRNIENIDLSEGIQKRDFIYIDDVVAAYMCIIRNLDKFEKYVDIPLGSGTTMSLRNLVELMKNKTNNTFTKLNFGKIPTRVGDVMESKADISFLLRLGWKPVVNIDEGIDKIINKEFK
jgi:nucleoside-diphosphate-sugar epimerase